MTAPHPPHLPTPATPASTAPTGRSGGGVPIPRLASARRASGSGRAAPGGQAGTVPSAPVVRTRTSGVGR